MDKNSNEMSAKGCVPGCLLTILILYLILSFIGLSKCFQDEYKLEDNTTIIVRKNWGKGELLMHHNDGAIEKMVSFPIEEIQPSFWITDSDTIYVQNNYSNQIFFSDKYIWITVGKDIPWYEWFEISDSISNNCLLINLGEYMDCYYIKNKGIVLNNYGD